MDNYGPCLIIVPYRRHRKFLCGMLTLKIVGLLLSSFQLNLMSRYS